MKKSYSIIKTPELERVSFRDKRFYKISEEVYYPSATTILNYFPKDDYFYTWMKDVGHNAPIIAQRAADEGSQVHDAIENLLNGDKVTFSDKYGKQNYSEKVWRMICRFVDFYEQSEINPVVIEGTLYSDEYKYAGTGDLICELNGELWLIDHKTSNNVHESYKLQIACYVNAWNEKNPENPIKRAGILWLKSKKRGPAKGKALSNGKLQGNGWDLIEIEDLEKEFEMFKHVKAIFDYKNPNISPKNVDYPTSLLLESITDDSPF